MTFLFQTDEKSQIKKNESFTKKFSKWKLVRRFVQTGIIFLLVSPVFGFTFFSGTLISSEIFGFFLTDPLAAADYFLAAKTFSVLVFGSALTVLVFYFFVGGRVFCSWVCPVFLLTELSEKLNKKFAVFKIKPSPNQKYFVLGAVLVLSFATSKPIFEIVSPIGFVSQNLAIGIDTKSKVFGDKISLESGEIYGNLKKNLIAKDVERVRFLFNGSLWFVLTIFLIDVFVVKNWWCKFTCPVGAFYSILGKKSPAKIKINHEACNNCGKCFKVCFVNEVLIAPVQGKSDFVLDGSCTNCLNCVDVCPESALGAGIKKDFWK
ncbi:4Fe-4S binding protein [bacterium]|nr:4Fe-4S binding protein [bacterium]